MKKIGDLDDPMPMFRGYGQDVLESELGEFGKGIVLLRLVDFVDDEHRRFSHFSKLGRKGFIERKQPFPAIHDEKQELGGSNGEIGLLLGRVLNLMGSHLRKHADTPGIHKDEALWGVCDHDVPSDSGAIVNYGNPFADQTVEESAFADVRASHYGYA